MDIAFTGLVPKHDSFSFFVFLPPAQLSLQYIMLTHFCAALCIIMLFLLVKKNMLPQGNKPNMYFQYLCFNLFFCTLYAINIHLASATFGPSKRRLAQHMPLPNTTGTKRHLSRPPNARSRSCDPCRPRATNTARPSTPEQPRNISPAVTESPARAAGYYRPLGTA